MTFDPLVTPPPLCVTDGSKPIAARDGLTADPYSASCAFDSRRCYSDDVLPPTTLDDDGDISLGNAEALRHPSLIPATLAIGANESDVIIGESGVVMPCSMHRPTCQIPSSLPVHVGLVVGIGAKEKVIGIDAVRPVASVTDLHSLGNRTMGKLIGEAMDIVFLPVKPSKTDASITRLSPVTPIAKTSSLLVANRIGAKEPGDVC